jgi:hypothetical protein
MHGPPFDSVALLATLLAPEDLRSESLEFMATLMAVLDRRLMCVRAQLRSATYWE